MHLGRDALLINALSLVLLRSTFNSASNSEILRLNALLL
nr:MAG TPA: hypothetical protein [Caudoviricetes sp.]